MIAVDQVDDIVRASRRNTAAEGIESTGDLLDMLGIGLTDLRDVTRRSTVLLSCIDGTWSEFTRATEDTVLQRFEPKLWLDNTLPDSAVAADLLASILDPVYRRVGFEPEYPSYPFGEQALEKAAWFSPRDLLRSASAHLNRCVELGEVTEAPQLSVPDQQESRPRPAPAAPSDDLDAEFESYKAMAEIETAMSPETEDMRMPQLLDAALRAFRVESERDPAGSAVTLPVGRRQAFHAELSDEQAEPRRSWSFLAISKTNPIAVQNRVAGLATRAGLGRNSPILEGRAVLWVTAPAGEWRTWGRNTKAAKAIEEFEREGLVIMVTEEDLRVFVALHHLQQQRRPGWEAWLRRRRPASNTVLFRNVFGPPAEEPPLEGDAPVPPDRASTGPGLILDFPLSGPKANTADDDRKPPGTETHGRFRGRHAEGERPRAPDRLPVGRRQDGALVRFDPSPMAKHTAVFAGSGSGKTVLLRRIVEAAALQGVPAIVLDPNNDLSRLGNAWPEPPDRWLPGDQAAAAEYLADTEVVVWTPGRTGGRPLSFQPLPDFAAVADDPDEFDIAVDTAVSSLAPRAMIDRSSPKHSHSRAVLRQALVAYARTGRSDFPGFLDFMDDLPPEASDFDKADDLARQVSATLRAAMVNDRIFAGTGAPADPGRLLQATEGKRARVSVVNFLGLPTEEQRQGFVNQLQLALFAWAKRNPATDRPLSAVFVLDEAQTFAPSTGSTVCLDSTLALVSQARKYGLGMVFATQAPKGIHNRIVGNCATHWYGRINSPSQIAAATQVAEHKGGSTVDIAHLRTGQFYLAADGSPTEQVDVPMCLSHHPPTAPTAEEILAAVKAAD
ncbi:ATP-binding protein [Glycomyces salinus]|uniref:ATP-binding protein n=1 Tax=Glycomyces salinus TaxID=980294 RepID=UPI0018ED4045|nr:ATP-binding protein [Glycomyces salinus]